MQLTKHTIARQLAAECGTTLKAALETMNTLLDILATAVREGDDVKLTGFATFRVVDTKEIKGRNPITGEQMIIPAGRKVKFKLSRTLHAQMNSK